MTAAGFELAAEGGGDLFFVRGEEGGEVVFEEVVTLVDELGEAGGELGGFRSDAGTDD